MAARCGDAASAAAPAGPIALWRRSRRVRPASAGDSASAATPRAVNRLCCRCRARRSWSCRQRARAIRPSSDRPLWRRSRVRRWSAGWAPRRHRRVDLEVQPPEQPRLRVRQQLHEPAHALAVADADRGPDHEPVPPVALRGHDPVRRVPGATLGRPRRQHRASRRRVRLRHQVDQLGPHIPLRAQPRHIRLPRGAVLRVVEDAGLDLRDAARHEPREGTKIPARATP
jgi:hypothetical protein